MPMATMPERAISEDRNYACERRNPNEEIVSQMLKLVGLNIAKVMADVKENCDDRQLLHENVMLLQDLSSDLNNIVVFMNAELLIKKNKTLRLI